ncbi:MAG: PBP1A family penicillin-binding protein [Archangium sp.]|nr:PBP1A family penicillin-binding protein [Archangium sp.]MDP3157062.1 PBP1A family penicillin-binding protein [Archangium sp.]MDP3575779.1 PBP1A family penicillin-binding protein [Archangium sp.]
MTEGKLLLVNVPQKRWWKRLFKLVGFLVLTGATAGVMGYGFVTWKYSDGLPDIPKVDAYRPPILTEVYTVDGVLAGEFYNERRKVVPYERIPKRLVQAFIAAEDADFFDHFGIDIVGTGRAVFKTVIKKVTGKGKVQGGSTITQQTAKAVLISAEGYKESTAKTIKRKVREALLARQLETELTKEEILYLYLNNVYLGHHSYGVQSAAENYYRKDVKDLTLAEMALLAGLPQAPSNYSPFRDAEKARKRRQYVLGQMKEKGMISAAEFDEASAAEVNVYPVEDIFHQFAPYFTEETRRDVVDRYGNKVLLNDGLKVFTTMDSERQRAAQEAVLWGLLAVDKRQGYRGPVMQLGTKAEQDKFVERGKKVLAGKSLVPDHLYIGLVTALAKDLSSADIAIGGVNAKLPALGMRWAREVNGERYYPSVLINNVKPLKVGDVLIVRAVKDKKGLTDDREAWSDGLAADVPEGVQLVRLEQEPEPQAAIVSIDPHRQYLSAMVGGYDFDANEFNRVFQACRQPGSSFKPIVYAGALELMGWTEGTVLVDSPIVYDDPENQNRWKPANYDEGFKGEVLLKEALVNSMNIPAVKTFIELARFLGKKNEVIGIKAINDFAHSLGFSTPLNPDYSAALGSSCVYPIELANVYATINRLGLKKPTYFVRKIEDRFGRMVEDHTAYDDPWASLQDRMAAGYARSFEPGEQVMSRETAYLVTDLMRGVVQGGTGAAAGRLGKPAAGKTGTTNDSFDAWFTAFTRDLVTSAWVGYDMNVHPLGKYETGGRAALPIWLSYMTKALDGRNQPEFYPPASLDLIQRRIDKKTGRLATGSRNSMTLWFKKGTEPEDSEPGKGEADANSFLQVP